MKCRGTRDFTLNIPCSIYLVFPATFHVISGKIDFIWDSASHFRFLSFHPPDKKQSSPLVELKNSDKMRKSMLNLEELLLGKETSHTYVPYSRHSRLAHR